jgi:glycosyltransferase 2 family protein
VRRLSNKNLTFLGLAISVALLAVAFWNVDFHELANIVVGADWRLLLVVVLLNVIVLGIRGWRWHAIISATHAVPLTTVTLATMVGHMANNILPARGGELVRVLVLGRQRRLSKTMLLGSLVVDHTLEGFGLVVLLVSLPWLFRTPAWLTTVTLTVGGVTLGVIAAALFVLSLATGRRTHRLHLPASWLPTIERAVTHLGDGLQTFHHWRRAVGVVAIGLVAWLVQGVMVYLCLEATQIDLDFPHALFVLAAINVAVLIPGAPSSLGPFELAAIVALSAFGVPKTPALSFALLYHFIQIVPTTVVGLTSLSLLGMRISDLGRPRDGEPTAP